MLPLFREKLWREWTDARTPTITPIPVDKAQLIGRVAGDSFDDGRTAAWMTSLPNPTWMAVRDESTGHTIHVVSNRTKGLHDDLKLGLKLMRWLSKRPVTWYWWDHPWARRMPAGVDPGRDHINGGWAIPGVPEVHVYRREEAHKVLLHECIHALSLDVAGSLVTPALLQFEAALGRRLWPHLGEAYTEFYAEFLWSIASSTSLQRASDAWNYQLTCSEKQAAQVWARIHDATKDEDTNVFAYYVLKWVLMQHLEEAMFQKNASVPRWFSWWLQAKPSLDQKARGLAASEFKELPMGMTCK
jgi:hypothetical protein